MLKISDAVHDIVDAHPYLRTALAQRLLNLSRVARHIHASVEARTHKPVQTAAIAMSLSRLQAQLPDLDAGPPLRLARRITVQRDLVVVTFPNTSVVQEGLLRVQERVRRSRGYLTISEGIREVTLITEADSLSVVQQMVPDRATRTTTRVASLSVGLTPENLLTPGILYRLLQPLALQGVNVTEVTSTTSEFHIYIGEDDVMLALDSLYGAYSGA